MKIQQYEYYNPHLCTTTLGLRLIIEDQKLAVIVNVSDEMLACHDVRPDAWHRLYYDLTDRLMKHIVGLSYSYRDRASVEFDGVEGLDDSLWVEFEGLK